MSFCDTNNSSGPRSTAGSVLDARVRKESRRSRQVIKSARMCLDDYRGQSKHTDQCSSENVTQEPGTSTSSLRVRSTMMGLIYLILQFQPCEEISEWILSLNTFDQRYIPPSLSCLSSNVSRGAAKFDPISSLDDEFYEYSGGTDSAGECHGRGCLEYDDGSYLSGSWIHGARDGHFRLVTCNPKVPVLSLEGDYSNDELAGRVRLQLRDESWVEGWFKDSVLHGFCRRFDPGHQLSWVGMYRNGEPFGVCWQLVAGGGCVVGMVDDGGHHTGDSISYIYPDNETAFLGQFHQGELLR